jgi:prefoldin alpha subunit
LDPHRRKNMVDQKELQQKIMTYRILQSKLEDMMKQREFIMNRMVELQNTIESLENTQKSEGETLFPLGPEVYVFGKTTEKDKMMVGIGANIVMEKSFEEGKDTLNKRKNEVEKTLAEIQHEMNHLSAAIQEMTPEIQEMIEKSQQAG